MNVIAGHLSIPSVSIEFTNVNDNTCSFNSEQAYVDDTKSSILREAKFLVSNLTTRKLEVGYVVNLEHLNCSEHIRTMNDSDYIVINIPLSSKYGKLYIKSYGGFKENMENIMKKVSTYMQKTYELPFSKPIYYKFNVRADLNLGNIERKKCSKGYLTVESQELVKMAKNISEKNYVRRHEVMFLQFLNQLVEENPNLAVIMKYTPDHANSLMTKTQLSDGYPAIPQLTKIPVKRLDKIGMQSISFLLEEIATSGFNTIMINGGTFFATKAHLNSIILNIYVSN